APADLDRTFRLPDFLPRLLVVGDDDRVVAVVLVALDDHEVLIKERRRTGAEAERRKLLDDLPYQLAGRVIGIETFGAEVGKDHRTVGRGRWTREAALPMPVVVDRSFVRRLIPENLAGLHVEGEHLESVFLVAGDAVGVLPLLAALHVGDGRRAGHHLALDHGRQVDAIAPHDRRRVP